MFTTLPVHVQQQVWDSVDKADEDQDGVINFEEFTIVIENVKSFTKEMQHITEEDIQVTMPANYLDMIKDDILLKSKDAAEWIAQIYARKITEDIDWDKQSNSFDNDLDSVVDVWDIDEIVAEVFGGTPKSPKSFDHSKQERRSKRDIVTDAIKRIVHIENKSSINSGDQTPKTRLLGLREKVIKALEVHVHSIEFE